MLITSEESARKEFIDFLESQETIPEPKICKNFGCGTTLSLKEELFGDVCIFCSLDITIVKSLIIPPIK